MANQELPDLKLDEGWVWAKRRAGYGTVYVPQWGDVEPGTPFPMRADHLAEREDFEPWEGGEPELPEARVAASAVIAQQAAEDREAYAPPVAAEDTPSTEGRRRTKASEE